MEKKTSVTFKEKVKENFWKKAGAGVLIGLVNGFFGSGGGVIAVQLMEKLGVEQKHAHATAILAILPLSLVSAVVYFLSGNIPLGTDTWFLLAGGAAGGLIGALLLMKLNNVWVNGLFTLLILISGVRMVF